MSRDYMTALFPAEWIENEKKGNCPVCGVPKEAFDPGQKKYCSQAHRDEYASKIVYWTSLREEVLQRDNHTCQICGITQEKVNSEYHEKKERWRNENVSFLASSSEFWETYKAEINKKIEEYVNTIIELMERISSPVSAATRIIDEEHYWLERALPKMKLPHELDKYGRPPHVQFEVDHIQAIANGGDEWNKDNLRTLCSRCHKEKTKEDMRELRNGKKGQVELL